MTALVVDHVNHAVADLDAAADRFLDEYGLASVVGGRHPGHGTANRIIPLGDTYIELIAVVDEQEAAGSPLGAKVLAAGEQWIGLAMRAERLGDHVAADEELVAMSRTRPDGIELTWRIAHFDRFVRGDGPFLIQWDVPPHLFPGATPVSHRVQPTGIEHVEVDSSGIVSVTIGLAGGGSLTI